MEITLTISQSAVLSEVAQTTNYTGAKMEGDGTAYDRISTVDEDSPELQRFWDESRAEVARIMMRQLVSEVMVGDSYTLKLNVSASFDTALQPGMQLGLFSYFVQTIVGKWYVYTNKREAEEFIGRGKQSLEEVKEKSFFKKLPTRPTYS